MLLQHQQACCHQLQLLKLRAYRLDFIQHLQAYFQLLLGLLVQLQALRFSFMQHLRVCFQLLLDLLVRLLPLRFSFMQLLLQHLQACCLQLQLPKLQA